MLHDEYEIQITSIQSQTTVTNEKIPTTIQFPTAINQTTIRHFNRASFTRHYVGHCINVQLHRMQAYCVESLTFFPINYTPCEDLMAIEPLRMFLAWMRLIMYKSTMTTVCKWHNCIIRSENPLELIFVFFDIENSYRYSINGCWMFRGPRCCFTK